MQQHENSTQSPPPSPSLRAARRLTARFRQICQDAGVGFDGQELETLEGDFSDAIKDYLRQKNSDIFKEIREVATRLEERLAKLREECDFISVDRDPLACLRSELSAVLENNETAADSILEYCEKIQDDLDSLPAEHSVVADTVSGNINRIFEACHFQDLNGQRIKKAMNALEFVEEATGELIEALAKQVAKEPTDEEKLMNGPALQAVSQEDINKLFDSF